MSGRNGALRRLESDERACVCMCVRLELPIRAAQTVAAFTLSPIKAGLQQCRMVCDGRLVQAPSGGASILRWNLARLSHLILDGTPWNS